MNNSIEAAKPVSPEQIESFAELGRNLLRRSRVADAEAIFRGLATAYPEMPQGFAGLGAVALVKEPPELDAAYENLTRARLLNPRDGRVLGHLGQTLLRRGRLHEAAEVFEKLYLLNASRGNTKNTEVAIAA